MKVLYVATLSNTINAFLIPHILQLVDQGDTVDIACHVDAPIAQELSDHCQVYDIPFSRFSWNKENFKAGKMLKEIIKTNQYDVIHTHTPNASAITRLVCRKMKNIRVIYTAHGLHFFKGASLKDWIIYYPIERWLSRYTHTIITINKEDYALVKRRFHAKCVEYIPGIGLDIARFRDASPDRRALRAQFGIPDKATVLLSVGELCRRKNHEVLIRALAKMRRRSVYLLICGKGPLRGHLLNLAKQLGIERQVILPGKVKDIENIYHISDIFLLPSLREGLGMVSLEAMAAGLPIITSNVQGIVDYNTEGVNGLLCKPKSVKEFKKAIETLVDNPHLGAIFARNNRKAVQQFSLENSLAKMREIYDSFVAG